MGDFGEQTLADFLLMLREFQFLEPFAQVHNRHFNQFGDALSANLYIVGFLLESGTMAVGTNRLSTESAQHHAVLYLVLVLLYHSEELIDAHPFLLFTFLFARQTVPQPVLLLLSQFEIRLEDREVVFCSSADEFLEPHTHLFASPANHTSVIYAHRSVRDDEFLIDAYYAAETFAGRAGSERGVEGKHIVGRLFKLHAVSFEPGREVVADIAWQEDEAAGSISLIEGSFGRIHQSADVILLIAYRSTVDDQEDFFILLLHSLFQFVAAYFQQFLVSLLHEVFYAHEFTFYIYTRVTFLVVHLQLFAQTAPFDDVDRGEDDKPGALGILSGTGEYIFGSMAFHLLSADRRIGFSDACVEQSQVFVDFGVGAHGRSWVARNHFLFDGDGRWQSLDEITFRFAHTSQKLASV